MRAVVLGGAGDMGSRAVEILAGRPEVSAVTIADLNAARAEKVAEAASRVSGSRVGVSVSPVDATDRAAVVRCLRGHDVCASALGPFYRFEGPMVEAALEAGVPYVSLCDDHDGAQAALAHDSRARQLEARAITGLGWTPGLTNLAARHGWASLDRTDAIRVAWAGSSADAEGTAVIFHTLHAFTGRLPQYLGGREVLVLAGDGREVVTFPPPVGELAVGYVGHPEPVTIPAHLSGVQDVTLKGGLAEPFLNWLAVAMARTGLTANDSRRRRLIRFIKPLLPYLERLGPQPVALSAMRVDVVGTRRGVPTRLVYTSVGPMAQLTAAPLALGAVWLATGRIARRGVFSPEAEGGVEPEPFFAELRNLDVTVEMAEEPL